MAQAHLAGRYTVIMTEEAAESTRSKKIRKGWSYVDVENDSG